MRPKAHRCHASTALRGAKRMISSLPAVAPSRAEFDFRPPLPPIPARQREELRVDEVEFRRLRTAGEIAGIRHLRAEIQLPASVLRDPGFHALEKKETRTESSAHSSGTAPSLGRSDWSPC